MCSSSTTVCILNFLQFPRVLAADVLYSTTSPWLAAFLITPLIIFCLLVCVCCTKKNDSREKLETPKTENDDSREKLDDLREKLEFSDARFYRDDVILDSRTAHPKLKVSEDGKSVWNTGDVSKVSDCEERFDSQTFILAKHGFSEGKHYWEVEIGQKKTWDLGVASATICRKGEITLSPENGYWVIGCDDGRDYWARTEQWTRLKVNGKLTKLGIFLDKSAGSLSFYDVCRQRKLHTYKTLSDGELFPFFSTGSVTPELDSSPLRIPPWNLKE